ncbi:MAG: hypothetical protein R2819_01695 [Allomuricauda sp.]
MNHNNLQDGAYGLLVETVDILNSNNVKYIIVGGWSPLLLNSKPITHPGTKDIDILFEYGYRKKELGDIILKFINSGFLLSAKHDFQLFKEITVQGKKFIYNIDLLHPIETQKPNEIYVDHIDLGIPSDKYQSNTFKLKSIALPSSQALFDNKLSTPYKIKSINGHVTVNLMDEIGTLITKSQSLKIAKRFRDSLDIYLAITQNRDEKFYYTLKKLKDKVPDTFNTLYGIKEFYDTGNMYFNIQHYLPNLDMSVYSEKMEFFFEKSSLNKKAKH